MMIAIPALPQLSYFLLLQGNCNAGESICVTYYVDSLLSLILDTVA